MSINQSKSAALPSRTISSRLFRNCLPVLLCNGDLIHGFLRRRFVRRRREIATLYTRAFAAEEEIILPTCAPDADSSWHLFVIQLRTLDRSAVFTCLQDKKLGVQVHYIPVHLQPYYQRTLGTCEGDHPLAEAYYSRAISIPLFPGQSYDDVQYVVDSVLEVIREFSG